MLADAQIPPPGPLSAEFLKRMRAHWRAANDLNMIKRIPRLSNQVEIATQRYWTMMESHKLHTAEHGDDIVEVRDWRWTA